MEKQLRIPVMDVSTARQQRPCIMVVDDEPSILRLIQCALKLAGFDVMLAASGDSALELMRRHRPDLVILDIMMPGLDGFQVLNRIRKQSDIPVIMLTARHEMTILRDSLVLGADDFITKPFSVGELTARIRAKLRRYMRSTVVSQRRRAVYHRPSTKI
jgi:two-component system alkaline phosphatase synthesis response regulator PhoP